MFDRVGLIGTGLIGGSIGLGLRGSFPRATVRGFDDDPATARAALGRGALTAVAGTASEAAQGAEVIVLSAPVDRIPALCREIAEAVPQDAVVTDVGSAKSEVVGRGEECFGGRFIGGHPMSGSERHGIEAADGRLFQDAWWILTPTDKTISDAYSTITSLVRLLGAKPVAIGPQAHDALVARLSHLPQLTASALVEVAAAAGERDALLGLAGAGFRDVTRIAASRPAMWVAIIRANQRAVLEALDGLGASLAAISKLISTGSWGELEGFLSGARAARLELFAKPALGGEPVALSMMVPDRPGVLAEVTTAAGELGVNIEDLRIVHSTEGGRGRLELVIAGKERAETLVGVLIKLGYHVERTVDE